MWMYLLLTLALIAAFGALVLNYFIVLPRLPFHGRLPELSATERVRVSALHSHVSAIASRPHNMDFPEALEIAASYITGQLYSFGLTPKEQVFRVDGIPVRNIEVVFDPVTPTKATQTYVIGAHYDSAEDSPGANDNGSAVAALLEIARNLHGQTPAQDSLRLVFFVNEEQPYGKTPDMGSWQHAKRLKDQGERVAGMIALETLGYFSDKPGSQRLPPPFDRIYPDIGNFVAFIGTPSARQHLRASLKRFRRHTHFPSIGAVAPGFVEGVDLSDHWSYSEFGFPAFMITDTAPFRNPMYHSPFDLP